MYMFQDNGEAKYHAGKLAQSLLPKKPIPEPFPLPQSRHLA